MAENQAERKKFYRALQEMQKVCKEVNADAKKSQPENTVIYEVIQLSEITKKASEVLTESAATSKQPAENTCTPESPNKSALALEQPSKNTATPARSGENAVAPTADIYLEQIADFYNNNWLGNKDFMHIPNFSQVMANYMKYPIIIAREEGKDEILAISTIKYDENNPDEIDPYFPDPEAKYFSITGILVKKGTPHKGMGKKIYEIALRGAYGYNKHYPGTRIMCVIDCRNSQSLRALSTAVETINENGLVGEGQELPANIVGYYELVDTETGALEEAPTLVLEVGLDSQDKGTASKQDKTLEYSKPESGSLFEALTEELKGKLKKYGVQAPIKHEDVGTGTVYYYSLADECSLGKTKIVSNGTEKGNDRTPIEDETKRTQGPVIMYFGDEDFNLEDLGDDTSER